MTTFTYSFPSTFNNVLVTPNAISFTYAGAATATNPTTTVTQYSLNSGLTQAFNMWSNVANLSYVAGNSATNHLNIAYWNAASHGSGTTLAERMPSNVTFNTASNFWIFLNRNNNVNDPNGPADNMITNPTINNWGVWNIAHELGHTLLGDNHTTNLFGTNDLRYSVMGYPENHRMRGNIDTNAPNLLPDGRPNKDGTDYISQPNGNVPIPLTPGLADIYLVQNGGYNPVNGKFVTGHGVSFAQDGNTSYTFTENSVALGAVGGVNSTFVTGDPSKYVMTLWDRPSTAGGIDTINASAMTTSNYINLNPGHFSSIGSSTRSANEAGVDHNVGIAYNAEIENALGGSASDEIQGNDLANTLIGNGGDDFLYGWIGGDALNGGGGNDLIDGGKGSNFLTGGSGSDTFYIDGTHGLFDTSVWWNTITDFQLNEKAYIQGWLNGVSHQVGPVIANIGAPGYTGQTFQISMDSGNTVDVIITFTGTVTPAFNVQTGVFG